MDRGGASEVDISAASSAFAVLLNTAMDRKQGIFQDYEFGGGIVVLGGSKYISITIVSIQAAV